MAQKYLLLSKYANTFVLQQDEKNKKLRVKNSLHYFICCANNAQIYFLFEKKHNNTNDSSKRKYLLPQRVKASHLKIWLLLILAKIFHI